MSVFNDMAIAIQTAELEKQLNAFILDVKEHNGKVWLQDPNNKELYIDLDRPFSINYYYKREDE